LLAEQYPSSEIIGVDTSEDMLATARRGLPTVQFLLASAATWRLLAPADLIFANAVMHWIPRHLDVLTDLLRWWRRLGLGGASAGQF
jgi:trans-aconitate 2-methyltransferase